MIVIADPGKNDRCPSLTLLYNTCDYIYLDNTFVLT